MKNMASILIAVALPGLAAAPAFAEGTKSMKTAVQVESLKEIHRTNSFVPMLFASIHIPSQKDIYVDISAECGLMTQTEVKSRGEALWWRAGGEFGDGRGRCHGPRARVRRER